MSITITKRIGIAFYSLVLNTLATQSVSTAPAGKAVATG